LTALAAAAEAAEDPRPEPRGRPLARRMETAWELTPRAQLRSGSLERRSTMWGKEGEVTEEMETVAGGREGSMVAVTLSPREREASAMAQLRKSKPGPRLATVAGAKVVTDLNAGAGSETLTRLTAFSESRPARTRSSRWRREPKKASALVAVLVEEGAVGSCLRCPGGLMQQLR
jgi:hypothetical protein